MSDVQRSHEERILDRVQGLIAKAESTESEEEKEAFFLKADELMTKYRIDSAHVNSRRGRSTRENPIVEYIEFPINKWHFHLFQMIGAIASVGKVRIADTGRKIAIVGFADDIGYVRLLWTSVHLAFASKIDPRWDTARTFDANVKVLKDAGLKWVSIAHAANAAGFPGSTVEGGWLKRAYRRECKRLGIEPTRQTQRHEAYRSSFATAFVDTIKSRLFATQSAQQQTEGDAVAGTALVLQDRQNEVNSLFYSNFPHLDPESIKKDQERRSKEWKEWWDSLTDKEKKYHEDRWDRNARRSEELAHRRHDATGYRAGESAGSNVDLTAGRNNIRNNEEKSGIDTLRGLLSF